MTVLDGKTGNPLVTPFVKSSSMANTSPLSVSMQGLGNDLFIYWISDCIGHEGEGGTFEFVEGTNVHEQSRADTCKLRYNVKSFSKLRVMNKNMDFPGKDIYYSGETIQVEVSHVICIWCELSFSCVPTIFFLIWPVQISGLKLDLKIN